MNIKLFLKGVLLYITFIVCMLAIGGMDSLYGSDYFVAPNSVPEYGVKYLLKL